MTTTTDDLLTHSSAESPVDSIAASSLRELVAELAKAEGALRRQPGDPQAMERMRGLVRELRRRRGRMRLEACLIERAIRTRPSMATTRPRSLHPPFGSAGRRLTSMDPADPTSE